MITKFKGNRKFQDMCMTTNGSLAAICQDVLDLCYISRWTAGQVKGDPIGHQRYSSNLTSGWQRGHKWSQLPGCVPATACECVGPYLQKVRRVQELLTELKNVFTCDISELKNATLIATQWQLPLRSIKSRSQGAGLLAQTVAEARYNFWRRFDKFRQSVFLSGTAGLTLADSNAPEIDKDFVAVMASETSHNFKWLKQQRTFELQLQHGNDCPFGIPWRFWDLLIPFGDFSFISPN